MKTEVEPEDLRNMLQAGVLIVDALLARQQDLADQAERWIREVSAVGGTVDIEPVTRTAAPDAAPLEAPFVLLGTVYRVLLDVDGRAVGLEVLDGSDWRPLARGFWDGISVELEGDDGSGDVLAPSCTLALREALRLWSAGAEPGDG